MSCSEASGCQPKNRGWDPKKNHPFVHRVFHDFHHPFWGTLPETNVAPENRPKPNRKVVFQPSICRGYVSFRECTLIFGNTHLSKVLCCKQRLKNQKFAETAHDPLAFWDTACFRGSTATCFPTRCHLRLQRKGWNSCLCHWND